MQIDIGFVFFGTCTLDHLDRAWYSLSRQDFTGVRGVHVLDNSTPYGVDQIEEVLRRYRLPVPIDFWSLKHEDASRAHSWTVNTLCRDLMPPDTDWIFWSRADYILDFQCLHEWRTGAERELAHRSDAQLFVTSYCHLIEYRHSEDASYVPVDLDRYGWREKGPRYLGGRVPGYAFDGTARDAGVWLTRRQYLQEAGWLDEGLSAWGFQQSILQWKLKQLGVQFMVAAEYFYHHQEHPVPRDLNKAKQQFEQVYPDLQVKLNPQQPGPAFTKAKRRKAS